MEFQYFAYADLRISGFCLHTRSYDHLPSYHMKGVYSVAQLNFKQLFENIVSQCVAMRTSQSINWVDSSNCENMGRCQHKMHCQCANNFPDTSASLQAGHQHNLLQRHCLNLRCVQETNW